MHVLRGAREGTPEEEEADAGHHDRAAAHDVREAAGEGEDGGGGEAVGGADPDELVAAVELVGDRRERGGDGGDVEGGEEVADDDGGEGEPENRAAREALLRLCGGVVGVPWVRRSSWCEGGGRGAGPGA